jgi:hypothetical protein
VAKGSDIKWKLDGNHGIHRLLRIRNQLLGKSPGELIHNEVPMLTIIKECPNGSCTLTPSSLDWYLKDGALTPHQSDRQTINLPVKVDSKVKFRMLGV